MKKFKCLLLILLVVILTGCSGTYNIKINDDRSVEEEAVLLVKSYDGAVDRIQALFDSNNIGMDKYKIEELSDSIKITYKEKYSSIKSYLSTSVLYNELFDQIDYREKKNSIDIYAKTKMYSSSTDNLNNITDYFNIENIDVYLTTDLSNSSNADSKEDGKLHWTIDKNTTNQVISLNLKVASSGYSLFAIIMPIAIIIALIIVIILYFKFKRENPIF